MTRLCLALITALYAIAFAFLAIMAVRWPSLLAIAALVSDGSGGTGEVSALINWRQLGLFYGGLYLFAAMCFYACSTLIQRKKRGALTAFVMGVLAGFPFLALFDFSANWWQAPTLFEQITIGAAIFSLFLMPAIRAVTPHNRSKGAYKKQPTAPVFDAVAQPPTAITNTYPASKPVQPTRRRKPVPAAIARQRQSFAAHGRRALARRMR
jgi:glucose dehydrogenase